MEQGYKLTNKETKWVNKIVKKAVGSLKERKRKIDMDTAYTVAIFAVTLFTRKLEKVKQ